LLYVTSVAALRFLEGRGDFGNPTRTERVWAYGKIVFVCELEHVGADRG